MHLLRYVMSRIFVFWLSISILVFGWFSYPQLVNTGLGTSETLVKNLTKLEATGKTETVVVHILHAGDLIVIGAIMLVVTLVFTALRNMVLGSGERRMTVVRAISQVIVLLLLSYVVLAAIWWYDARLVNAAFDASKAMLEPVAAAIDPAGRLELVFRTLGLGRHLVMACIMLALVLTWIMLKWVGRGAYTLVAGRPEARELTKPDERAPLSL